jgi:hypothetical protein
VTGSRATIRVVQARRWVPMVWRFESLRRQAVCDTPQRSDHGRDSSHGRGAAMCERDNGEPETGSTEPIWSARSTLLTQEPRQARPTSAPSSPMCTLNRESWRRVTPGAEPEPTRPAGPIPGHRGAGPVNLPASLRHSAESERESAASASSGHSGMSRGSGPSRPGPAGEGWARGWRRKETQAKRRVREREGIMEGDREEVKRGVREGERVGDREGQTDGGRELRGSEGARVKAREAGS